MVDIWLKDEHKVLLSRFPDSEMVKDNEKGNLGEYWRRKVYIKDYDLLKFSLDREYAEPYQVATARCNGNWNYYNAPFVVQIPQCNLDCVWCYVPKKMRYANRLKNAEEIGKYFSAQEIIEMWKEHTETGILRISGGEPFLAPDFLVELGETFRDNFEKRNYKWRYLWFDTNLLGTDYREVIAALSELRIPFGVCGCFKGFDRFTLSMNMESSNTLKLFNKQIVNAKEILDAMVHTGELFFYVPEITQHIPHDEIRRLIRYFVKRITTEIHQCAPLRTTVLHIKDYAVNKGWKRSISTGTTKRLWYEFLLEMYPKHLLWLPQYQIPLKGKSNQDDLPAIKCYWCGSTLTENLPPIQTEPTGFCSNCQKQIPHTMKVKHINTELTTVKRALQTILETGNKTAENHQQIAELRAKVAQLENIEVK